MSLETYLHSRLKNTRPSYTVDVPNAAAERRGDLAQVRSKRAGGQIECWGIGEIEGIEAGLQDRFAEQGKGLEERQVIREVTGAAKLIALRSPERAWNRIARSVGGACRRCRKGRRVEPGGIGRSADIMRDLIRAGLTGCLGRSRGCAGGCNGEGQAGERR